MMGSHHNQTDGNMSSTFTTVLNLHAWPKWEPTLDGLPNELLIQIVEYVDLGRREVACSFGGDCAFDHYFNAMHSLCLVSKRLHTIAQPLLYTFFATEDDGSRSRHFRRQFLRKIIENPALAKGVTGLSLAAHDQSPNKDGEGTYGDAAFLSAARQFNIGSMQSWLRQLEAGNSEAENVLLVALTQNLTTLDIGGPYTETPRNEQLFHLRSLCDMIMEDVSRGKLPTPLYTLRHLKINYEFLENGESPPYDPFASFSPKVVHHLLNLPSLQSAEFVNPSSHEDFLAYTAHDEPQRTGTSVVETLAIFSADLNKFCVQDMIGACKALKSFTYTWSSGECLNENYPVGFDNRHICDALESQKDSLEILVLEGGHYYPYSGGLSLGRVVGTFKGFTELRHIEISVMILMGTDNSVPFRGFKAGQDYVRLADIFPRSLETLTFLRSIVDEDQEEDEVDFLVPFLVELTQHCAYRLPNLRRLDLSKWYDPFPEDATERIRSLLDGTDVEFVVPQV